MAIAQASVSCVIFSIATASSCLVILSPTRAAFRQTSVGLWLQECGLLARSGEVREIGYIQRGAKREDTGTCRWTPLIKP